MSEELEAQIQILQAKICLLSKASDLYWSQTKNAGWTKAGGNEPTYSFFTALSKRDMDFINQALTQVDYEAENYWDEHREKVIRECIATLEGNEGYHTNISNAFGESWDQGFRCAMRALQTLITNEEAP